MNMEIKNYNTSFNDTIINLIKSSTDSERYERKIPLKMGQSIYLKNILISKGFVPSHPNRNITSIYYDTDDYLFARQNINGENLRVKPRIRFYNNQINNSVLELKIKRNYNNYKKIIKNKISNEEVDSSVIFKKYEALSRDILNLQILPSSIVSYERSYFSFKNIRLTIDKNVSVKKFFDRKFLNKENLFKLNLDVIEFKYNQNLDNFFRDKFSYFLNKSIRSNKCSKYIQSVTKF